MLRTALSLFKTLFITVGVFVGLIVFFHLSGALYTSWLGERATTLFNTGLESEFTTLRNASQAVSHDAADDLLSNKTDSVLKLLKEKQTEYSTINFGVADASGVLIGSTKSASNLGSNVFLGFAVGRAVAARKSPQSVEVGINPSAMVVVTGLPIIKNDELGGALFSSYTVNDAYATHIRDAYLPPGSQVVFYTKEFGVSASSFTDPSIKSLVASYFNSGSDWIQKGTTEQTIYFKNNEYYFVKNIVFPGLEQSPGGVLIFLPRQDPTSGFKFVIILLTLGTFLVLALFAHRATKSDERTWRYYILLMAAIIPVAVASFVFISFQNQTFLRLKPVPYNLYNSTLRFQPESGIYSLGFDQTFQVVVDTGDESINAAQFGIRYDPSAIKIVSIDVSSSTCSYVIENTIDKVHGEARMSCVLLNISDEGRHSLPLADIVTESVRAGTFSLSFDPAETKVLADDGLGTNVLRMSQDSSYKVDTFDSALQNIHGTSTPGRTFVLFSPSHPNQSRWYSSNAIRFVWRGKAGSVYLYNFDEQSTSDLLGKYSTTSNELVLQAPGDGVFYFHLGLSTGGRAATYKIQVDQTPPTITSFIASNTTVKVGDVVRFSFDASDAGSGIQKNYYIDLGGHLFLPVGTELMVPFLTPGDQTVTLRVYDNAGNYSEKSMVIHVAAL